MKKLRFLAMIAALGAAFHLQAQVEEEEEEYDFDNVEYAGEKAKLYANPKIFGLSPQRFVSIGYDYIAPHSFKSSGFGTYEVDENPTQPEEASIGATHGLRIGLMTPIISTNRFLWQMSANFWQSNYNISDIKGGLPEDSSLARALSNQPLRNTNWINTFFIPLDEKQFILIQGQLDLSGDYSLSTFQSLQFLRYSAAVLWGKRPNDRKQWAVGLSRTYRVGNMNYIPVLMYNWTSISRKWGSEVLFPARAHMRYTPNSRSLLLMGYELEGQSYHISQLSDANNSFEVRRGELRFRLDYQRQLTGFFWVGAQLGIRYDYSFDADILADNKEFFRGFFGTQTFAMRNNLGLAPYFNISLNFVSP